MINLRVLVLIFSSFAFRVNDKALLSTGDKAMGF